MQRSRTRPAAALSPSRPSGATHLTSSSTMALSGTGHISSQTMQLRLSAQGRQRSVDIRVADHRLPLSSRVSGGMRRSGRPGRRRCSSSRSSPAAGRAPASTAPPARPASGWAAGPRSGRPSGRCRSGCTAGGTRSPARPGGRIRPRLSRTAAGSAPNSPTATTAAPAAARNCRRDGS